MLLDNVGRNSRVNSCSILRSLDKSHLVVVKAINWNRHFADIGMQPSMHSSGPLNSRKKLADTMIKHFDLMLWLVIFFPWPHALEKYTCVAFSAETLLVMWPNLFTVWHSVGADGPIATLGSKRRANKTLFTNQYKKSHKRNTYDR